MTTFLILGGAGLALILVTLVVGDVLDGVLHLDVLDSDFFSVSSLAAFVGAFGFGGALGLALSDSVPIGVLVGLVIGLGAAWGAVRLTHALRRDDSVSFHPNAMIGHSAFVITPIPAGGFGEIRLTAAGHVRKYAARCDTAVPAGAEVWVSAIVSPTAVQVEPVGGTEPALEPPL